MTFQAYTQSNLSAVPVSLYRFTWGFTQWAYNNADREFTVDGITYIPAAISEGALAQRGKDAPSAKITVPMSLPVVAKFRGTPPSTRVKLEIRSFHPDDPDQEAVLRWKGPITNVRPVDNANAEIVSRMDDLKRRGTRQTFGRGCKFALFGPGCEVVKALHANARTVTAISGNTITLNTTSPSENYFNGGFVEWDADGLGTLEARDIRTEISPGVYELIGRSDGMTVGMAVTAYPGCARNTDHCLNKFDNLANYPGLDFMREESIFDGKALA